MFYAVDIELTIFWVPDARRYAIAIGLPETFAFGDQTCPNTVR